MEKLYQKNLLDFVVNYFKSIGLEAEAKAFFTSVQFSAGIVLNLPAVCVVQKNKPADSKSKQSHIHVTGDNRLFFYPAATLNSLTASTDDAKRNVTVSMANIENLNGKTVSPTTALNCKESFTMTKVAFRKAQDIQVQISKTRLDGDEFMDLRNSLFMNDLLIFLKYRSSNNNHEYFAVGIPKSFYSGSYDIQTELINHLEDNNTVTVKNAINEINEIVEDDAIIEDSDDIADTVYQQMIDMYDEDYEVPVPDYVPETYSPSTTSKQTTNNRPSTNPKLGKEAIRRNNYKCIFCTDADPHDTFIKPNGKPYMEVHHIIPMKYQVNFTNKLDTAANLAPVCPLCHRKLHHGKKSDVSKMLKILYNDRAALLKSSGIEISESDLVDCY